MMRYLCLDYGEKRIGMAMSDPTNTFSVSLPTIENNRKLFKVLEEIIVEKDIFEIVFGYPLTLEGTKSELCNEIDDLIDRLKIRTKLPVEKRDERFSSRMAESQILESVKSKIKRKEKSLVDKFSASVILQEYLDFKKYERKNFN